MATSQPATGPNEPKAPGEVESTLEATRVSHQAVPRPAIPTSGGHAEETRALLRRRLILLNALGAPACAILVACFLLGFEQGGLRGRWADLGLAGYALVGVQLTAVALWLWRHPLAELTTLRWLELAFVGTLALLLGGLKFIALVTFSADSPDERYAATAAGLAALLSNLPFYFFVPIYGVLIPNTRRRGLLVVVGVSMIPVLATVLAAVFNPPFREHAAYLTVMTCLGTVLAGGPAVFGAARITSLERQAYEARREAQEVGPYSLVRLLGRGGMGEVHLAQHRLLKRPCAIKLIHPRLSSDPESVARFTREVQAVTALTHLNTVRVYDYGRTDDGAFYYVMEYLQGPTLDALVRQEGPLAAGRAVRLLRQVCGALAEAHAAGLVHRDLKPANILVATLGGQTDVAKLLDFGLVKDLGAEEGLTRTGTVMGTPAYLCPEQAGGEPVDARGDVYSLGAVAFYALTGRPPFEGGSAGKLLAAHLTQPAPRADEVWPSVPADVADVVARCLAKQPGERYQSVRELESALAACGCGERP